MDTPALLLKVPSTFPVDDHKVRARRYFWIAKSPVTWGPALAIGLIAIQLDLAAWSIITVSLVAVIALWKYWQAKLATVDEACLRELIEENSLAQNMALEATIASLETIGQAQYAIFLRRFLILKRAAETELHRESHLSLLAREVDEAIDGISKEVCLEITRLCGSEHDLANILTSRDPSRLSQLEATRHASQSAILHAYTTLHQTHSSILALNATGRASTPVAEPTKGAPGQRLTEILTHLQDEAEIISRTQARIQASTVGASSI